MLKQYCTIHTSSTYISLLSLSNYSSILLPRVSSFYPHRSISTLSSFCSVRLPSHIMSTSATVIDPLSLKHCMDSRSPVLEAVRAIHTTATLEDSMPSPLELSPFMQRKRASTHEGPQVSIRTISTNAPTEVAASTTTTAEATPTDTASSTSNSSRLPSHIHSATCGCGSDATIPNDDQYIGDDDDDDFHIGSKAFVAQGVHHSVTDTLDPHHHHDATLPARSHSHGSLVSLDTPRWSLASLMEYNQRFVARKQYEPFLTDRFPYKKLVVVTCMDTRLTELLPMALDLKNGDAKIIKVAGAIVAHPFGSVMRSILVAVYGLGAEHIIVVGHHDW